MTKEELKKFQRALENMERARETAEMQQGFLEEHNFDVETIPYEKKIEAYDYCISELRYVIRNINPE